LLLALGSDIAVSVQVPGQHAPREPNVLQLHRAVTQPQWPKNPDGTDMLPHPYVFADPKKGARIFIRQAYRWMLNELPLAKTERSSEGRGNSSHGVAVLGNAGIGKARCCTGFAHFLLSL
jgi:hypothetical protein